MRSAARVSTRPISRSSTATAAASRRRCRCTPTARSISRRCATRPAPWATRTGCCRPRRSIWTPTHEQGIAHGVVMRFKDVPIFYSPYLAFPLGDERQSGVLFPSFGHSGRTATSSRCPIISTWRRITTLTLTPGYLSERGVQLGGEFRFLTASSQGQIEENFLPNDAIAAQRPGLRAPHRYHRSETGAAARYRHRKRERQQLLREFRRRHRPDQRYLSRTPRRPPVLR